MVTIALAKGRLAKKVVEIFTKCGIDCSCVDQDSRKLVFTGPEGEYRFILVKPSDVPTYVDRGVADIGIVGKDTLLEESRPLYEMVDLKFGACRICICGPKLEQKRMVTDANLRVATKYVNIAREYYREQGITIDIIKLNGSVELGPILGLSDVILDIVESGKTLEDNGLEVKEELFDISARLIVNRVSLKMKKDMIDSLIKGVQEVINND